MAGCKGKGIIFCFKLNMNIQDYIAAIKRAIGKIERMKQGGGDNENRGLTRNMEVSYYNKCCNMMCVNLGWVLCDG